MNKAKNRLILCAVLAVFVLLAVLIGAINLVSFTMAADDADVVTAMLASRLDGGFAEPQSRGDLFSGPGREGRMGPMGPRSPETEASVRYFIYAFDKETGEAREIARQITAVPPEEAEDWARSLRGESTGWTRGTYRYRVWDDDDGHVFVAVIDQGRELLPSYRLLAVSLIGALAALLIMTIFLLWAGKKLFAPLEDADRKQKQFITGMEQSFRVPLTVIGANAELIERENGAGERTAAIRRQVRKMDGMLNGLSGLAVLENDSGALCDVPLSELLRHELDAKAEAFGARGVLMETEIAEGIVLRADPEACRRLIAELADNAGKYALSLARFTLAEENGHVVLTAANDAALPDGPCDRVFDRFTTLSNAPEGSTGLGLSTVKETARLYNGRVKAFVENGVFTLRVTL